MNLEQGLIGLVGLSVGVLIMELVGGLGRWMRS